MQAQQPMHIEVQLALAPMQALIATSEKRSEYYERARESSSAVEFQQIEHNRKKMSIVIATDARSQRERVKRLTANERLGRNSAVRVCESKREHGSIAMHYATALAWGNVHCPCTSEVRS